MGFFSDEQRKQMRGFSFPKGSLEHIVSQFPIPLKQAMFAASQTGRLNFRSWNNCAFNAAGKAVDAEVNSTLAAAQTFGITTRLVADFISKWDGLNTSPERLPAVLKNAILDVGITTPPEVYRRQEHDGTLVIDHTVFKGSQTEWLEQLESVDNLADLGISDEEVAAVAGMVGELAAA